MSMTPEAREELAAVVHPARTTRYEDGKGGWLFRPASPTEIADAILAAGYTKPSDAAVVVGDVDVEADRDPGAHLTHREWLAYILKGSPVEYDDGDWERMADAIIESAWLKVHDRHVARATLAARDAVADDRVAEAVAADDDGVARMSPTEFDALLDYSASLPTGTTVGKRWKRRKDYYDESKGWVLGEYVEDPDPDLVGIRWRDIEVVARSGADQ